MTAEPPPIPAPVPAADGRSAAPDAPAGRALAERVAADGALAALAARWVPLSAATPEGVLDVVTAVAGAGPLVVLGAPGSGKTAALQTAWHRLARAGQAGRPVAPLYIDLAHARDGEGLTDLIARALDALGVRAEGLAPTHLLLDNLDRMRHRYLLDDLRLMLDAGGRVGPTAVMACRSDDWDEIHGLLPALTEARLQPITPSAVRDALVRFLPAATAEAAAAWLDDAGELAEAVRQPRVLAAFLDVAAGVAPAEWRAARVGEALLGRVLAGVPSNDRGLYRDALADVALSALGRAFVPQVDTMAMRLGATRYDMLRTGAVVPRGADLEFTEPLLARHCAALALVTRFGNAPEALARQLKSLDDPAVGPLLVHAHELAPDPDRFLAALRALPGAAPIVAACLGLEPPPATVTPVADDAPPAVATDADAPAHDGAPDADPPAVAAPQDAPDHPAGDARGDGDAADAVASLHRAWQLTHSAEVAYALAEVEANRGALAEAAQALGWAIAVRPDVAGWRDALGQIEAERGRWIEAGEAFAAAARLAPDDAGFARRLARARLALGDAAGAADLLLRRLAAAPDDAAAHALLARTHEARGATDDALAALSAALRLDDTWPDDLLLVARLTCDQEQARPGSADLAAAHAALDRAAGRIPPSTLAATRAQLDRLDAARTVPPSPAPPSGAARPDAPPDTVLPAPPPPTHPTSTDVARIAASVAAGGAAYAAPAAGGDDGIVMGDDETAMADAADVAGGEPASLMDVAGGEPASSMDVVGGEPASLVDVAGGEPASSEDVVGGEPWSLMNVGAKQFASPLHRTETTETTETTATTDTTDTTYPTYSTAPTPPTPPPPPTAPTPPADLPPLRPPMPPPPDDASAVTRTAALLSVAGMYQEAGHAAAAYVVVQRAQDELPPSASLSRRAGELALSLGDAATAVEQFGRAVALDAEDVVALRALAEAHRALGEPGAALAAYEAAAQRSPGDADLWLAAAAAATAAGEPDAARRALERAVTAAPDRPDVHAAAAEAALAAGDVDAARSAYERAATFDLTDPCYVLPLVDLCLDDAPDRAAALLERLPAQADVVARRARLAARRGDWAAAAAAWADARRLPSGAGDLSLAVCEADALVRCGRAADAAALLELVAPAPSPRPPAVDAVLGAAYAAVGRERDALVSWSAAAAGGALAAPDLVRYSRLAGRLGALDEAVRAAEAAVLRDGGLADAAAAQADALAAAGRLEAAAHAARAALDLAPDVPGAYLRLAALMRALGRAADERSTLEAAAARLPEAPALHHALGRSRAAAGDDRGARDSFVRAAALAPGVPAYQRDLAASLAADDPSGARDALERVVAAAPDDAEAFRAKAELERAAGDRAAERASLERATALAPQRQDLWLALARACLAAGDLAAADAALDRAQAAGPAGADLHAARGAVHEAAGRLPVALDHFEAAARLAPGAAAWSDVGRLRLARGDVAGALTALAESTRLDDGDPATHRALAEALERIGQPADAAEQWAVALRLAPDDAASVVGLGRTRLAAGDPHGAAAILHQAPPSLADDPAVDTLLAEALSAVGRHDEAEAHAARATALAPTSAAAWQAAATVATAAGDGPRARQALAEAARLAPSAAAFAALAERDEALGDAAAALASWRRVLERDPEHAVAALHYGRHVAAADWQLWLAVPAPAPALDADVAAHAEHALQRAGARLDGPDAAAAARALAVVRGRAGHVGGAVEAASAAVAIAPDADSLVVRAWAMLAAGDTAAALADLRLAAARGADDATRHALLARAAADAGDRDGAATALLAAIERAPGVAELPCRLAELELAAGDRSAAAATLRLAASQPMDPATERRLAALALEAGAPEVACGVLEARADAQPTDPTLLALLAEARRRLGDLPGAGEALESALRYGPEKAEIQAQLGDLLSELGDLEAARARYLKAVALQPYEPAWRLADAAALLRLGRRDAARAALTDALTFAPSSTEVRLRLAALVLEDGDADAAHAVLEPARAAAPEDARVHLQLGHVARARGDLEGAAAALDAAARLDPADPRAFVALGDLHLSQDELDDAIQAYEHAVAVAPRSAPVYLKLAGACRKAAMVERALFIHEQAVDLAPDDAAPRLAFGQLLAELGHFARAVEVLSPTLGLIVEGDPRLPETLTLIANLYARLDQHERARPFLEQAHALQPNDHSTKRLRANQIVQLFARGRSRQPNHTPRDPTP